jgi:hypothetical protein
MRLGSTHVVLDTCVLMPPRLSDVLMDLRLEGVFSLHWTQDIDAEYLKNMEGALGFSRRAAETRLRAMKKRCPAWEIHSPLLALPHVPPGVHANDRPVAAASLRMRKYVDENQDSQDGEVFLVTDNTRHFAVPAMARLGVLVMKAGSFLDYVYQRHPEALERAVIRSVSDLATPPYTRAQMLKALRTHGAVAVADDIAAAWGLSPKKTAAARRRSVR